MRKFHHWLVGWLRAPNYRLLGRARSIVSRQRGEIVQSRAKFLVWRIAQGKGKETNRKQLMSNDFQRSCPKSRDFINPLRSRGLSPSFARRFAVDNRETRGALNLGDAARLT